MAWMDTMNSILLNLEQKDKCVEHMIALTGNMEKSLISNDMEQLGLNLELRQEDIDTVTDIDKRTQEYVDALPSPLKERVREMLTPGDSELNMENPMELNVFDTNRRIVINMRQLKDLDTAIRSRV